MPKVPTAFKSFVNSISPSGETLMCLGHVFANPNFYMKASKEHVGSKFQKVRSSTSAFRKMSPAFDRESFSKAFNFINNNAQYVDPKTCMEALQQLKTGYDHVKSASRAANDGHKSAAGLYMTTALLSGLATATHASRMVHNKKGVELISGTNEKIDDSQDFHNLASQKYEAAMRDYLFAKEAGMFNPETRASALRELKELRENRNLSMDAPIFIKDEYKKGKKEQSKSASGILSNINGLVKFAAGGMGMVAAKQSKKAVVKDQKKAFDEGRKELLKNPELLLEEFPGTLEQLSSALQHDPELHESVFSHLAAKFAQEQEID